MPKWFGKIGFGIPQEVRPGVFKPVIVEHEYYGDVSVTVARTQASENVNDNIKINNTISIVADPFAVANFSTMKYIIYEGIKWKMSSVEVQYPRLIITMGEVYNGPKST